jgi:hypothetical protein
MRGEETCPFPFEEILVDQCSELHQLMAGIDHVDQSRSEQVILSGTREWGFMATGNCKVSGQSIRNPAIQSE